MSNATNESLDSLTSQSPILVQKLKRKHDELIGKENNNIFDSKSNNIFDSKSNNNIFESKSNNNNIFDSKSNKNNIPRNTVVINLADDIPVDDYFDNNGFKMDPIVSNGRKQKKSNNGNNGNGCISKTTPVNYHNGYDNHENENELMNADDFDIVHDDLNDLLLSSLISQGIEVDFVKNSYFQKFINMLVKFSISNKNYHLPTIDKLTSTNINNLKRKFEFETKKVFSECDSIIISFESGKMSQSVSNYVPSLKIKKNGTIRTNENGQHLNVNLLISTSDTFSNFLFQTIPICGSDSDSIDKKLLNTKMNDLFQKLGSDKIHAIILPYKEQKCSQMINLFLPHNYSHIVPLNNAHLLFHNLLCDICRVPWIFKLVSKSIELFHQLVIGLDYFTAESNQQLFTSDHMKLIKCYLPKNKPFIQLKSIFWACLNLMLTWLVDLEQSVIVDSNLLNHMLNVFKKCQFKTNEKINEFFQQISILYQFLKPFLYSRFFI